MSVNLVEALKPEHSLLASTSYWGSEILAGLQKSQKELPGNLLYDQRGSQLFDRILETPEYYLSRTETKIMENNVGEIARLVGRQGPEWKCRLP